MEDCPVFIYTNTDFVTHVCRSYGNVDAPTVSRFDMTLRCSWTDKMNRGLFRYHLGDIETRIVPGPYRYVAQLNILRGKERRKPQEIMSVQQSFDARQFNFNKINPSEFMFELVKQAVPGERPTENGLTGQSCRVVINVSPLEFGHCLLVPEPARCLPQVLTPFAIQTGIETVFLSANPGFRVGFNSLGAFASVNHLHLHGYYLDRELGIEYASAELLVPDKKLHCTTEFPAGFLFYTEGQDLGETASAVCQLTDFLIRENIAHNLFMTRGCAPDSDGKPFPTRHGVRIMVWPRKSCFGAKEETAFNVALCELAGHLPFKNREDFERIKEEEVKSIVQKYLLCYEEFDWLQKRIKTLFLESKA
ncbi:GDP-D-glucose phosphorylase 1 [Chanos chanos]|uniref:GDP-D-glucose phosphorylase 1 n=1 Tax=Chanos chanos TaxID=29144 RepID=A0A6J2VFK0_CHACN|nr:GDP-D-glucose phosphorylase 1 [Chanos chanos]